MYFSHRTCTWLFIIIQPGAIEALQRLIMQPTTDEWDLRLPDHEEWFVPLWLDILDSLEPAAYFRFFFTGILSLLIRKPP